MKKYVLTLIIFLGFISMHAQGIMLNGKITDLKNNPLEFSTIMLLRAKDSSIIKIAIADIDGNYELEAPQPDLYFIKSSFIGYNDTSNDIFELKKESNLVTVDIIKMEDASVTLGEVVVKASKPLIVQKIDRLVVNVDAQVTNIGTSALEVLQKSPGISLNQDGKISLKGKSEVLVMLDGKPSYLSNAELTNLLSSMSSNQISQIEIITNPSAKFDASGNGGVINIVTKKNTQSGINGNITLSYGQGQYSKSNNSLLLNYKNEGMNVFFNYAYNLNNNFLNFDINRSFLYDDGKTNYTLSQLSNRINSSQTNTAKFGIDFYLDKNTTLGFSTYGFINPSTQNGFTSSLINNSNGQLMSSSETSRDVENKWQNRAFNLNFNKNFNTAELSSSFDFLKYDFTGTQNITGINYDANNVLLDQSTLINKLPLGIDIYSGRVDYNQTFKSGINLQTGIKSSFVNTKNISDFFQKKDNILTPDSTYSNAFDYKENINAIYLNLNKKFDALTLQAGLRTENTIYTGVQSAIAQAKDSTINRNYTKLFPSLYASYEINTHNELGISISRRIDRPAYQRLNPFIGFIDKYTYSTGNPFLQPQFSWNVELSHAYNGIFVTTINYSKINNMINEMFLQQDSIVIRTYGNIGTRNNFGISESVSLNPSKWYSASFFINLYQDRYNGLINGLPFKANQTTLSLNTTNNFTFGKGWTAELSGNYLSKNREEGQAIIFPSGQLSFGISKSLFDNKGTIKFNFRDLFYTLNPIEEQNFQNIASNLRLTRDTRVATLAFTYRFGASIKPKSSAPTDEQKRVQTY